MKNIGDLIISGMQGFRQSVGQLTASNFRNYSQVLAQLQNPKTTTADQTPEPTNETPTQRRQRLQQSYQAYLGLLEGNQKTIDELQKSLGFQGQDQTGTASFKGLNIDYAFKAPNSQLVGGFYTGIGGSSFTLQNNPAQFGFQVNQAQDLLKDIFGSGAFSLPAPESTQIQPSQLSFTETQTVQQEQDLMTRRLDLYRI